MYTLHKKETGAEKMDIVVIGAIAGVSITIIIAIVLAFRIGYLIRHTHSKD